MSSDLLTYIQQNDLNVIHSDNVCRFAACGVDSNVMVWDLSGTVQNVLVGHTALVNSVVLDCQLVVSGSSDYTAKVWDANTGTLLRTLSGHTANVTAVALKGDMIASGSEDTTVKLWSASTGDLQHTFTGHTDIVNSIAICDDSMILSAASDNCAKMWNANTGLIEKTFVGHTASVNSADMCGNYVVTGANDCTVRVWDKMSGNLIQTHTEHCDEVTTVVIEGQNQIVAGSCCGNVCSWDLECGELCCSTNHVIILRSNLAH